PVVTDYPLSGVVKRVEKSLQQVTIDHEEIPGFMDAMKMRFSYKDGAVLDRLEPGDRVHGTLRVKREHGEVSEYQLPHLVVDGSKTQGDSRRTPQLPTQAELLKIGDAVPDFTMTFQDGEARKLSDLRGNVVVLTFIYTRCPLPDFCPLMDRKFAELAEH